MDDHAVGRAVHRPGLEPEGFLEECHRLLAVVVAEHGVEALDLRVSHGKTIRDTPGCVTIVVSSDKYLAMPDAEQQVFEALADSDAPDGRQAARVGPPPRRRTGRRRGHITAHDEPPSPRAARRRHRARRTAAATTRARACSTCDRSRWSRCKPGSIRSRPTGTNSCSRSSATSRGRQRPDDSTELRDLVRRGRD